MARILIVGDAHSPLIRERGLIGRRAGHEVFWMSPAGGVVGDVRVFSPPAAIHRMRAIRQLALPFVLRRALTEVRPDLIHVHYAYQALGTYVLRRFHPLVVSVMGGDILPDQSYHGYRAQLVRSLLDAADCITSKSEFLDAALGAIGPYHEKIRRITWGVDLNHYSRMRDTSRLRRRLGIRDDEYVFFDARLAEALYNKDVILAAFAAYLETGRHAVLIVSGLFGHVDFLAQLRQRARDLGIVDRVRFVGGIDPREMADYYALADVTISVPASDGFPQTIYEAAASGSFLILSDLPQYREAVRDGLVAHHVRPGDPTALAAALIWFANHPEARVEATRAAWTYTSKVADKRMQDVELCDLYAELLQRRQPRFTGGKTLTPG